MEKDGDKYIIDSFVNPYYDIDDKLLYKVVTANIPMQYIVEFVPDVDIKSRYSIYSTYGFTPDGNLIVK